MSASVYQHEARDLEERRFDAARDHVISEVSELDDALSDVFALDQNAKVTFLIGLQMALYGDDIAAGKLLRRAMDTQLNDRADKLLKEAA